MSASVSVSPLGVSTPVWTDGRMFLEAQHHPAVWRSRRHGLGTDRQCPRNVGHGSLLVSLSSATLWNAPNGRNV